MQEIPKIKENIDWSRVIAQAEDHIERLFKQDEDEGVRDDDDHYIFEAVISAMYGEDIWEKYRACQQD